MQEYGHITPQQRLIIRISRNSLVFASINNESGGAISFYPYVLKSGISMAANLREAFRTEDILRAVKMPNRFFTNMPTKTTRRMK